MKIFIGPTEVAGIAHGLVRGLRRMGLQADAVFESPHPFVYEIIHHLDFISRWWCATGGISRNLRAKGSILTWPVAAVHLLLAWPVLVLSLMRYEAFIYLSGKTITNTNIELFLMRLMRKRTIVIFVGSDARPPYINGAWPWVNAKTTRRLTKKICRRVHRFENAGVICVNAPGTAHFHRRPVINWFAIGLPSTIADRYAPRESRQNEPSHNQPNATSTRVRLLHSPSNSTVKGTARIEKIVKSLVLRGFPIDWIKISGLSNAQVLDEIQRCDLVVDQLFSDTPMAGLATEAAQLGKPALVGSYLALTPNSLTGTWQTPPSRFVGPEQFESALEALVNDVKERQSLGEAARKFVESEWSCEAVASRVASCLFGEIPDDWWFEPSTTTYLQGCGLDETEGRRRVSELVNAYGETALGLDDKPALIKAFLEWARQGKQKATNA